VNGSPTSVWSRRAHGPVRSCRCGARLKPRVRRTAFNQVTVVKQSTKRGLSVFGVFISILGFYIKNTATYPFVLALVAPSYVDARAALTQIHRTGSIGRDRPEFQALATIAEDLIAPQNPSTPRPAIILDWLVAQGGGIAFGTSSSKQFVNLKMFFRGQPEPVQGDLIALEAAVEASWNERSTAWAGWLFWIGIAQTIWPMFSSGKDAKAKSPAPVVPPNNALEPSALMKP